MLRWRGNWPARVEGFTTTCEEMTLGACSVAVPVWAGHDAVAAVWVVLPDFRSNRARLAAALTMAARGIAPACPRQPLSALAVQRRTREVSDGLVAGFWLCSKASIERLLGPRAPEAGLQQEGSFRGAV